ncbi:MAG: diguanylate cyclase [Thermoanaerobaculia bacterium]
MSLRLQRLRGFLAFALPIGVLAVLYLIKVMHAEEASGRRVGFILIETGHGVMLGEVLRGFPASEAGVLSGDRLLEIGGTPIRSEVDYDRAALGFHRDEPVPLLVDRSGQRLELTLRPGVPPPWFDLLLDLVVALAYLVLAALAFRQARRDIRARLLVIFAFAVALEHVLPFEPVNLVLVGLLSTSTFYLLTGLQMALEVHLALLIPERPTWLERRRWVIPAIYAVGAGVAAVTVAALLVETSGGELPWSSSQAEFVLISLGLPVWALLVLGILGERFVHHPRREGRQMAGLVFLGALPWALVVVAGAVRQLLGVPPLDVPDVVWSLAILCYPVALCIAIYRYRLFDIEMVIRKSLLYGALTTALVVIFYGALAAGGVLFARYLEGARESVWVVSAATLVLGLLFHPLRLWLQGLIDRRLFPQSLAYRQRVLELASELPGRGKLPRMGEHLCAELCRIFGLRSATLWIAAPPLGQLMSLASAGGPGHDLEQTVLLTPDDPGLKALARHARPLATSQIAAFGGALGGRISEARAEMAVPLLSHGRLGGVLLLGAKRDGERFFSEELDLLKLLASQVATVFENARLFESATFEGLTGLYRREAVLDILDREWSRSVRYDRPLAIALADLDRFKTINDRQGHLVGDVVLQRVAAELKGQLRETDFIGRFGGEEFLLVLPETEIEGAALLAEKIRARIEELSIPLDDGGMLRVTISIGVASRREVQGDGHTRARPLLSAADGALYAAKHGGRNRVEAAKSARAAS